MYLYDKPTHEYVVMGAVFFTFTQKRLNSNIALRQPPEEFLKIYIKFLLYLES